MEDEAMTTARRRILWARETYAALVRVASNPTPENIAAPHRLHATHLREMGDPVLAEIADARAQRVEHQAAPIDPGPA
jgi:hypothetical protein